MQNDALKRAREAAAMAFDARAKKVSHPATITMERHHAKVIRAGEGDQYDAVQAALIALTTAAPAEREEVARTTYTVDERGYFCRHCGRASWLHYRAKGIGNLCNAPATDQATEKAIEAGRIVLEGRGDGTYAEAEQAIRGLIAATRSNGPLSEMVKIVVDEMREASDVDTSDWQQMLSDAILAKLQLSDRAGEGR